MELRVEVGRGDGGAHGLGFVRDAVKCLLYMHAQTPAPFDDLRTLLRHGRRGPDLLVTDPVPTSTLDSNPNADPDLTSDTDTTHEGDENADPRPTRRRRTLRLAERRVAAFLAEAEALLSALATASEQLEGLSEAAILFGPSRLRPVAAYRFAFAPSMCRPSSGAHGKDRISSKVIRALLTSGLEFKQKGLLKVFVLLRASATSSPSGTFLPLRESLQFGPKVRLVCIKISDGPAVEEKRLDDAQLGPELMWFCCSHTPRGLQSDMPASC